MSSQNVTTARFRHALETSAVEIASRRLYLNKHSRSSPRASLILRLGAERKTRFSHLQNALRHISSAQMNLQVGSYRFQDACDSVECDVQMRPSQLTNGMSDFGYWCRFANETAPVPDFAAIATTLIGSATINGLAEHTSGNEG